MDFLSQSAGVGTWDGTSEVFIPWAILLSQRLLSMLLASDELFVIGRRARL
jgi:hypothetical protein